MLRIIKYLDFIIYWSIVLIPFSISIAPGMTFTFMGFLFFSFLLKKIIKRERLFIKTPINPAFMFLMLISILSFKNTIDTRASLQGVLKLVQNAFLFLICAEEIRDKKHISRVIISIIIGASLASFDALWQMKFGRDFIRGREIKIAIGLKRATAAFPNANVFGIYMSAIVPLIIGLSLFYCGGKKKIIMLFISVLTILGLATTFSRGSGLGLYISVLLLGLAKKNRPVLILCLAILLIFPFIVPKNIKVWAREVNYNPIIFMCNADRISIYRNTFNMVKHHPILGVGVNTFLINYQRYKLPEPDNAKTADAVYAHNNFLQIAGDIGLLGLAAFFWLLFELFKKNVRIYNGLKDNYLKIISLSLSASLVSFLVNGLTETSLYYARVAMIFWFLIGFSLALSKFVDANNS